MILCIYKEFQFEEYYVHSYIQASEWLFHGSNSCGLNHKAISLLADSTESEPWMTFLPTWMQKSPLMVPGLESNGFVAPNIFLPVSTALSPSQTMQQTGPEAAYSTNPLKNPLPAKSE